LSTEKFLIDIRDRPVEPQQQLWQWHCDRTVALSDSKSSSTAATTTAAATTTTTTTTDGQSQT